MVLRKPYALFIKLFRPIHFIFIICTGILIYNENKILTFLNSYLYTDNIFEFNNVSKDLISSALFIIPIILMIFSLLMFGIMFRKKKPYIFYFVSIFLFLAILVINIYNSNFLKVFESTTVSIKAVKLIHDFNLMTILLEAALIFIYVIRGFGINFKKFDFSSDIAKFDIKEEDKEEFELDLKFDFNETKRKRREKLRNLKYIYLENKFIINLISCVVLVIIAGLIIFKYVKRNTYNTESVEYNLDGFNIIVDSTNLINTNYEGNRITENYLVIVNAKLNTYSGTKALYLKDFTLKIGNATIYPTKKYAKYLTDVGSVYNNNNLTNEYRNYLFVYEIPLKFITSDMFFTYSNLGYSFDIKLKPKNLVYGNDSIKVKKGSEILFDKTLGNLSFNIKSYEIKDYYKIDYDYCISNNNCFNSIEYLRPSIDENFDKTILKLDIDYNNETSLSLDTFYDLLKQFGDIYYLKDNVWKIQDSSFEYITSKKGSNNYNYIGIDKDIKDSKSIKFVFNIRGIKYEYILK